MHVGRPRALTPHQVTHAHELLAAGQSQREVAQLFGVSPNVDIRNIAMQSGESRDFSYPVFIERDNLED